MSKVIVFLMACFAGFGMNANADNYGEIVVEAPKGATAWSFWKNTPECREIEFANWREVFATKNGIANDEEAFRLLRPGQWILPIISIKEIEAVTPADSTNKVEPKTVESEVVLANTDKGNNEELTTALAKIAELETALKNAKKEVTATVKSVETEIPNTSEKIVTLTENVTSLEAEKNSLEKELRAEEVRHKTTRTRLEENIKLQEEKNQALKLELDIAKATVNTSSQSAVSVNSSYLEQRNSELEKQVSDLRIKADGLLDEISALSSDKKADFTARRRAELMTLGMVITTIVSIVAIALCVRFARSGHKWSKDLEHVKVEANDKIAKTNAQSRKISSENTEQKKQIQSLNGSLEDTKTRLHKTEEELAENRETAAKFSMVICLPEGITTKEGDDSLSVPIHQTINGKTLVILPNPDPKKEDKPLALPPENAVNKIRKNRNIRDQLGLVGEPTTNQSKPNQNGHAIDIPEFAEA